MQWHWWTGWLVLVAACAPGTPAAEWDPVATRDSAVAMFNAIPDALADRGPQAWLDFFAASPAFVMASDGAVAFPSRDSAITFLQGFAPTVASMSIEWLDLRADAVGPGIVSLAAGYRELIVMRSDSTVEFDGYVTGLATSRGGAWRLQQLHWSSPPTRGN